MAYAPIGADDTGTLPPDVLANLTSRFGGATRTGVFQMDHPNSTGTVGAATFNTRQVFTVPFDVKRFRVHYRNRNFITDTDATCNATGFKGFVGEQAQGSDAPSAAFTAAPVQILPTTTLVNGTEKITPWILPATFTVVKNKRYMLSTGFTITSSDQITVGGGGHFVSTDGDKAGQQAANSATFLANQSIFDVWIEYEYVCDEAPSILVVSNSTSGPGNTASVANRGDIDTWLHQWEMANRGVAASIAVAGSWASMFPANSPKWLHYDTLATPIVYDAVVLMALSSSDVAGGDGSTGAQNVAKASYGVVVNKARALYPKARIVGTTNPPRQASTGALETARIAVNGWLRNNPFGQDQCYDIDILLRNPTAVTTLMSEYNADGTHWAPPGHWVIANNLPVTARSR